MELCILGQEKNESDLRLLEEAKKVFDSVFFVPINSIGIGLNEKFSISYRTSNLLKFPTVFARVPKKFYSYAYQLLSLFPPETFMPIPPISFLLASERFFLLTVLRKRGVSTLNTYLAKSSIAASRILEITEFPLVIRVPGKETGMVVKSKLEAKSIIDALNTLQQPILLEELIKNMVSVYVAEPEVIAAVKKTTKEKDVVFGKGEIKGCKIDVETRQLALDAAKAIDAKALRVDIALNSEPKVVDIHLSPGLISPSKASGTDIPKKIIHSIHYNYELHKEKPLLIKFFEDAKSVVKDVFKERGMVW